MVSDERLRELANWNLGERNRCQIDIEQMARELIYLREWRATLRSIPQMQALGEIASQEIKRRETQPAKEGG